MKKINQEELTLLQSIHEESKEASRTLGNLQLEYETKKASLFNAFGGIQSRREKIIADLKSKYGEVEINVHTGEITE
jgi:hypothetical protein